MVAVQKEQVMSVRARSGIRWQAPATLAIAEAIGPAWRDGLAWPRPVWKDVDVIRSAVRNYVDAVLRLDDPDVRAVALLTRRFMPVLALIQVAAQVGAEEGSGAVLAGGPEIDFLRGQTGIEALGPTPRPLLPPGRPTWLKPLRRAMRTASWTPLLRLPRALVRPDGTAVRHNALMRRWIEQQGLSIRAAYHEDLTGKGQEALAGIDPAGIARELAIRVACLQDVPEPVRGRLVLLLERILAEETVNAAAVLGRLRMHPQVPRLLLTGSGSQPASRAIGLEVLRRDGEVIRFAHGGSELLFDNPDSLAERELSVSSSYVVPSPEGAQTNVVREAALRVEGLRAVRVVGGSGDPSLDPGQATWRAGPSPARPRVMYVGTAYYGLHQVYPPLLPALLYLDWQIRLLELLKGLPIELICKPHPEGLYTDPPLLAAYAAVSNEPFETALSDVDVLVYDYAATTTFSVGLCSDRPIILIDHGTMRFNETVRPHIEARCRIVRADFDTRNRPVVSRGELAEAICSDLHPADPSYFRRLFLAEGNYSQDRTI
jgi:hypothetical protein